MTPREFDRYVHGQGQREVRRWQRAAWAAWHGAMWQRAKRLQPASLKRFLRRLEREESTAPLTPEQFYAKLRVWHLMFGGGETTEARKGD